MLVFFHSVNTFLCIYSKIIVNYSICYNGNFWHLNAHKITIICQCAKLHKYMLLFYTYI